MFVTRLLFFFFTSYSFEKTYKTINEFLVHVFKLKTHDATLSSKWISKPQIHICTNHAMGTAVAQWLRCCATNRKVAGSIPDGVIGIFH